MMRRRLAEPCPDGNSTFSAHLTFEDTVRGHIIMFAGIGLMGGSLMVDTFTKISFTVLVIGSEVPSQKPSVRRATDALFGRLALN